MLITIRTTTTNNSQHSILHRWTPNQVITQETTMQIVNFDKHIPRNTATRQHPTTQVVRHSDLITKLILYTSVVLTYSQVHMYFFFQTDKQVD